MPLFDVSIPQMLRDMPNIRYVAVNELQETNTALIREQVKRLRFNVGVVQCNPFQVLLGQLGVCRVARVLSNGLDGIWAILRLLSAGNSGQPEDM
jgi:hypothetical protein